MYLPHATWLQFQLLDTQGKLLLTQQSEWPSGRQNLPLDLSLLAPGIYHLSVRDMGSGDQWQTKVVKVNYQCWSFCFW